MYIDGGDVELQIKPKISNMPPQYCYQGCQNFDLDPAILWFYDSTYPKQSKSFKDLCDHSESVGSYVSDDPKRPWFFVIFFNLTEDSIEPKWKIKSHKTNFFYSNVKRVSIGLK